MSRPPHDSTGSHPPAAELARLAETAAVDDPRLVEHLATCARCMAIYTEFATLHAVMNSKAGLEPAPPEWVRRGLAVAEVAPTARPAPRPFPRARTWWLPAAAAAAVLVLAAAWWGQRADLDRFRTVLATQMSEDSNGGLLYAETILPSPRGLRGASVDSGVDRALAEMGRRYNGGARSGEDAFWLVSGFLSKNDLDNADAHLRESLERNPGEDRLRNLAGILAFKRSDLSGAAGHLESALAIRRTPTALYNLALVRRAAGDSTAAGALAREIMTSFPASPLVPLAGRVAAGGPAS